MFTKAKEPIKVGIALVLAYAVGLSQDWMNPQWIALGVAMTSLPTAGQSLNKGMMRIGGTLLAWVIGLFYLGLFPQDRWLFLLSFTPTLFFLCYKMTGKDGEYFWYVAAFVSMLIMQQLFSGEENGADYAFEYATFRVLETAVGIAIWTLVSVFIWPRSNRGALEDVSGKLLATQRSRMSLFEALMLGTRGGGKDTDGAKLQSGHEQASALLTQLGQTLAAAASESYEVNEVRPLWQQFHDSSLELMQISDKLQVSSQDLARIDLSKMLPDLPAYFSEMDARLAEAQSVMTGSPPARKAMPAPLSTDDAKLAAIDHFDRAAVVVARGELQRVDELTKAMLDCVAGIKGHGEQRPAAQDEAARDAVVGPLGLPPLDPDRVRASVMVVVAMWSGALIYIYFDPPGHYSWFEYVPQLTLLAAQNPQARLEIFKLFATAYPAVLLVYVFIMPQLSAFWQLGLVIFGLTFVARYFFTGLSGTALLLGMFNMLDIQNEQSYDFASMANSYVFTLMGILVVFLLTYITRSPRQEKAFLVMLRRFFRSSEFVVAWLGATAPRVSLSDRIRFAYHRHEVRSLPAKLGVWGNQIDRHKFPANSQELVTRLVARLQVLAYRMEDLIAAHAAARTGAPFKSLQRDIDNWLASIQRGFKEAADHPEVDAGELQKRVSTSLGKLSARIEAFINEPGAGRVEETERRIFYQLLGAFRSLNEAGIAYAGQAGNIDWAQWREERF